MMDSAGSDQQANTSPFDPYSPNGIGSEAAMNSLNGLGGVNGTGFSPDPMLPLSQQQLQYQAYLAAQARGVSPAGLYPPVGNAGFGYPGGSAPMDNLRTLQGQPPLSATSSQMGPGSMLNQSAFSPQQFSPVLKTPQMYQYPPQYYSQGQSAGGRRGRMSHS